LLPGAPSALGEKNARQDAEKRLKALDPQAGRIDAAVDEFERKLASLELDAVAARSMPALERLFRLRGALWNADGRKDRAFFEVFASGVWQETSLTVVAHKTYRVRAAGVWQFKGLNPGTLLESTANGSDKRPANGYGRQGQLIGQAGGKFYTLGESATFTPEVGGKLLLMLNEEGGAPDHVNNKGSVQVLIEP
jgi:hypothetical protein